MGPRKPFPWVGGKIPPHLPETLVVVCGTRDFEDQDRFDEEMDKFLYWLDPVTLVIGGDGHRFERGGNWVYAGADYFANVYADRNWLRKMIFRPNWGRGLVAGPERNIQMAKKVSPNGWCLAFWDGKSKGTKDMIQKFLTHNSRKQLWVIRY